MMIQIRLYLVISTTFLNHQRTKSFPLLFLRMLSLDLRQFQPSLKEETPLFQNRQLAYQFHLLYQELWRSNSLIKERLHYHLSKPFERIYFKKSFKNITKQLRFLSE
mgnify:CR=1 FL=1